jgi:hypothetical protein
MIVRLRANNTSKANARAVLFNSLRLPASFPMASNKKAARDGGKGHRADLARCDKALFVGGDQGKARHSALIKRAYTLRMALRLAPLRWSRHFTYYAATPSNNPPNAYRMGLSESNGRRHVHDCYCHSLNKPCYNSRLRYVRNLERLYKSRVTMYNEQVLYNIVCR